MRHARHGAPRPGSNIRRSSGDRAGHANAAEQTGSDIGDPLPDQFAIGAMAPSRHTVGDDGREQRFDGAEKRERNRVRQHRLHLFQVEARQRGERKFTRNSAELRSDGVDRQFEREGRERSQSDNNQHGRPAWPPKA